MKILGISTYYHESAAAIIENGKVLFAAQEERFSRIKTDASFPEEAIKYCLYESGLAIEDIDIIAFYDKPFLKFERFWKPFMRSLPKVSNRLLWPCFYD